MADDSPGKVQALKAIFSEKNNPVMGLMPPGGKIPGRPWRALDASAQEPAVEQKKFGELKLANNRVLPVLEKIAFGCGDAQNDKHTKPIGKPVVGPKPSHLAQQPKGTAAESANSKCPVVQNGDRTRLKPPRRTPPPSQDKSRAFGETIASFMFANNKENENANSVAEDCVRSGGPPPLPPVPKPRISQMQQKCLHSHVNLLNFHNAQNGSPKTRLDSQCCNIISSDNYICKSDCRMRRKVLPPQEKLGPAPLKPIKPSHLKLPSNSPPSSSSETAEVKPSSSSPPPQGPAPVLSQRPPLQRPSYPCPPRPVGSPPLPPVSTPVIKLSPNSLREEIEELYEDTLLGENKRPVSLIPEYTEEEELSELYHDAAECYEESSSCSDSPYKYKRPPLPTLSEYLQPNSSGSNEELYQDANGNTSEEFYEVMPCDEIPDDTGSPLYCNNKKEIEKVKKEEKRIRKEQKEREKRVKEQEKLRKKFNLTGEEIPIDDGLVKWDSRGGRGDLPVKKGETVLILRMEGNPSGRWLVKNEKGKIGYVELTNIEVDPLSVKSVMTIRRLSVISNGDDLYCEAKSEEEEGIYEITY